MAGYSATTTIDAPIEDVHALVADLSTHPRWAGDELTVERAGDGTWRSTARAKGATFTAELTVVEDVPHERFVFDASDQTGRWRHRFELEPTATGCRVTRHVEPLELDLKQRLLYVVARLPVKIPSLRTSLQRLASTAER